MRDTTPNGSLHASPNETNTLLAPILFNNSLNQPLCRYNSVNVLINTSTYQMILSGALRLPTHPSMKVLNRQCHGGSSKRLPTGTWRFNNCKGCRTYFASAIPRSCVAELDLLGRSCSPNKLPPLAANLLCIQLHWTISKSRGLSQ